MTRLLSWTAAIVAWGFYFWVFVSSFVGKPFVKVPASGNEISVDLLQGFAVIAGLLVYLVTFVIWNTKRNFEIQETRWQLQRRMADLDAQMVQLAQEVEASLPARDTSTRGRMAEIISSHHPEFEAEISQPGEQVWGPTKWNLALFLVAWAVWLITVTIADLRVIDVEGAPTMIVSDAL